MPKPNCSLVAAPVKIDGLVMVPLLGLARAIVVVDVPYVVLVTVVLVVLELAAPAVAPGVVELAEAAAATAELDAPAGVVVAGAA